MPYGMQRPPKGAPFTLGNPATMGLFGQQPQPGGNMFAPGNPNPWASPGRPKGQPFYGWGGQMGDMNAQRLPALGGLLSGIGRGPAASMPPQGSNSYYPGATPQMDTPRPRPLYGR